MKRAQPGFTLVELLVVISIIGVLVGLTLPAVNSARETARKSECANNMKNLALAGFQHEGAKGRLPGWIQSFGNFPLTLLPQLVLTPVTQVPTILQHTLSLVPGQWLFFLGLMLSLPTSIGQRTGIRLSQLVWDGITIDGKPRWLSPACYAELGNHAMSKQSVVHR